MKILIIAFENGRWGPARLPCHLVRVGLEVHTLCPDDNALANTSHVATHHTITDVKSSRRFTRRLAQVMEVVRPVLVIPSDERVVAALHSIIKRRKAGKQELPPQVYEVILRSLGNPDHYDDLLLKDKTLKLARKIGVKTPPGSVARSAEQAQQIAGALGFPVYVKTSFSWAGRGAVQCQDSGELASTFASLTRPPAFSNLRYLAKKILARDWYPSEATIEIQKSVSGKPAMFCALAWQGKLLGGFAGKPQQTDGDQGPSTVVWIGADKNLEQASRKLIESTGASGFLGFDFAVDDKTGEAFLLECNPRPIQVCHLGELVGVNLCNALALALKGKAAQVNAAAPIGKIVPLFPQEWLRDEGSAINFGTALDVPQGDEPLLNFMIEVGIKKGRSPARLRGALYPAI